MMYEIWDVETGNCIGRFDNEPAAFIWVRTLLDRFGVDYADHVVLGINDELDVDTNPWSGDPLHARVIRAQSGKPTAAD